MKTFEAQNDELKMVLLLNKLGWHSVKDSTPPPKGKELETFGQGGYGQAKWNGQEWTAGGIILPAELIWFWKEPATRAGSNYRHEGR